MISSSRRNALFVTAATVVLISALIGCRGFFVKPTLSSITVTPASPNLQVGQTLQLAATGNFNDGTTGSVSNVSWSSSDSTHVTVSSTGLIKGIANTTSGVTITATAGTASGSATVTVGASSTVTITSSLGTSISLAIDPVGTPISFTAQQNGSDVTSSATWSSSNQNVILLSSGSNGTVAGAGTTTITATTSSGSGTLSITVQ